MSSKSRGQIATEISTNFPDNTSGAITPEVLRNTTQDLADSALFSVNDAYIFVVTSGDPSANGAALKAAYAAAKALTPNGAALSATNRAAVILPPGRYQTDGAVNAPLAIDTQYIDIVGLTGDPDDVIVTGKEAVDATVSTVVQTVNDVHWSGVTLRNMVPPSLFDGTDPAAWYSSPDLPLTVFRDCVFIGGTNGLSFDGYGMRINIKISSSFYRCRGGDFCFGGDTIAGTNFAGYAEDCTAEFNSFGGNDFTGVARRCKALGGSFGANNDFSGQCYDCELLGGSDAFGFGVNVLSTARFERCKGGNLCFGLTIAGGAVLIDCAAGYGSYGRAGFAGLAIRCTSDNGTNDVNERNFGGQPGQAGMTGTMIDCSLAPMPNAWAPPVFTGTVVNTKFAPTNNNQDGVTLPDTATGTFKNCTFVKKGTGTPIGLAAGSATPKISYCQFNTTGGYAAGITNAFGATLADAFNLGNTSVA